MHRHPRSRWVDFDPFQELFGSLAGQIRPGAIRANVFEEDNGYVVEAELPGVDKSRVSLQVEGREVVLSVSAPQAEQPRPEAAEGDAEPTEQKPGRRLLIRGRFDGEKVAAWTFRDEIDAGAVEAKLENGVLVARLPRARAQGGRSVDIN
jgi:HSP20 family protein